MIVDPEPLTRAAGRPDRRDLGVAAPASPRAIGSDPTQREQTFRAYLTRHGRGPVPAHRRPGLPARRRAVRHRPAEGPDHRPRRQPLSAGHRGDGRQRATRGVRAGLWRGVRRRSEGPRAAGDRRAEVERAAAAGDWTDVIAAVRRAVTAEHELPPDAGRAGRAGTIPKTSSGKIQRHACREEFLDGTLQIVAEWRGWDAGEDAEQPTARPPRRRRPAGRAAPAARASHSCARAAQAAGPTLDATAADRDGARPVASAKERTAGLDARLDIVTDLGLDSLERLQIATSLEETFGGRFPEDVLPRSKRAAKSPPRSRRYLGNGGAHAATRRPAGGEIPPECYDFDQMPEYKRLKQTMRDCSNRRACANPYFSVHERVTRDTTLIDGRELISFSSYNYLGMSGDPAVVAAPPRTRSTTSAPASRPAGWSRAKRRSTASWSRRSPTCSASTTRSSSSAATRTNETTIGHLFGPGDLIAARRAGPQQHHPGGDPLRRPAAAVSRTTTGEALDELLTEIRRDYRRVLIAIEGVYSMDGDFPDLPRFIEVKKRHKAILHGRRGPLARRRWARTAAASASTSASIRRTSISGWARSASRSAVAAATSPAARRWSSISSTRRPASSSASASRPANAAAALASLRLLEGRARARRRGCTNGATVPDAGSRRGA